MDSAYKHNPVPANRYMGVLEKGKIYEETSEAPIKQRLQAQQNWRTKDKVNVEVKATDIADANAHWIMKEGGKKGIEKGKSLELGTISLHRAKLRNSALYGNSLDQNKSGDFISSVYNSIRQTGVEFRKCADNIVEPKHLTSSSVANLSVKRGDFYEDMVRTGALLFNGMELTHEGNNLRTSIKYPIFSHIKDNPLPSAASYCFMHEVFVRLWVKDVGPRLPVTLTATPNIKRANYDGNFTNIQLDKNSQPEALAKALSLDKRNITNLTPQELDNIQRVASKAGCCNTTTRFVKWWSYWLYSHFAGGKDLEMRLPDGLRTMVLAYNSDNLAAACDLVLRGETTVIHCNDNDDVRMMFLCLGVLDYPAFELNNGEQSFYCGGFDIRGEVTQKNAIVLIGHRLTGTLPAGNNYISKIDMYLTMCSYARSTNRYKEMMDGLCLALCLVCSDGMPSFSLPKSQGIDDLFAPTLKYTTTDRKVVPYKLNENLLKGAFVVTRQMIGHIKDMNAISQQARRNRDNLQVAYSNPGVRHNLYGLYKKNFFQESYAIAGIIDPLHIGNHQQVTRVDRESFLGSYWTYNINNMCLIGSFHYYVMCGYWEIEDRITEMDRSSMKQAFATYNICKVFLMDDEPLPWLREASEEDINAARYRGFVRNLIPGKVMVLPGEVGHIPHQHIDIPDDASYCKVQKPNEQYNDEPTIYNKKKPKKSTKYICIDDDEDETSEEESAGGSRENSPNKENDEGSGKGSPSESTGTTNASVEGEKPPPVPVRDGVELVCSPQQGTVPCSAAWRPKTRGSQIKQYTPEITSSRVRSSEYCPEAGKLFSSSSNSYDRNPRLCDIKDSVKRAASGKDVVPCMILQALFSSKHTCNAHHWFSYLATVLRDKASFCKLTGPIGLKVPVSYNICKEIIMAHRYYPKLLQFTGLGRSPTKDRLLALGELSRMLGCSIIIRNTSGNYIDIRKVLDSDLLPYMNEQGTENYNLLHAICSYAENIVSQEAYRILQQWRDNDLKIYMSLI